MRRAAWLVAAFVWGLTLTVAFPRGMSDWRFWLVLLGSYVLVIAWDLTEGQTERKTS